MIAYIEKDMIVGVDIKPSATNDAGSGPADVTQSYEASTSRGQMEAGGYSRGQNLSK